MMDARQLLTSCPPISEALLKDLEARFPSRCPDINDLDREIWIYAGKVSLIAFLRSKFDEQNNNQVL